jgi:hypothetical protein
MSGYFATIKKFISVFFLFQEFTLTDDTVLEEHFEDPRLTQIKVLGEGGKKQLY